MEGIVGNDIQIQTERSAASNTCWEQSVAADAGGSPPVADGLLRARRRVPCGTNMSHQALGTACGPTEERGGAWSIRAPLPTLLCPVGSSRPHLSKVCRPDSCTRFGGGQKKSPRAAHVSCPDSGMWT